MNLEEVLKLLPCGESNGFSHVINILRRSQVLPILNKNNWRI